MCAQTTWMACFYLHPKRSVARTRQSANMLPLEGGNMPPGAEIGQWRLTWRSLPKKPAHHPNRQRLRSAVDAV